MDVVLTHEQVSELLGAYALDSVGPDEAPAIARHVAECPRCEAELRSYHEVAGMLGNAGGEAPPHLWERLSAEIARSDQPASDDGSVVELLGGRVARTTGTRSQRRLRRRAAARREGAGRWSTGAWVAVGGIAAALVALVVVVGLQVHHLDQRVGQLEATNQQVGVAKSAEAAMTSPGARTVTLSSTSVGGGLVAQIVMLPSGESYVVNSRLPGLPSVKTYQLWGRVGTRFVSLGLLGNDPAYVALHIDPSARISLFALTAEPSGGVIQPTSSPLAASRQLAV